MTVRTTAPVLALLLALAAAPAARADHDRPFKGAITTTTTIGYIPTPAGLYFEGTLVGQATVVGKITGSFAYVLDPTTGAFSGVLIKVAANGDEVHETFSGQYNPFFTGSTGETTIVGGTGRFEGVTGGVSFVGTVTSPTTAYLPFNGTISQGK